MTRNPRTTLQVGATMVLNAMQNHDERRYAMVESIGDERPHAAMIAATEDDPVLLRAILRLVKRVKARPTPSPGGKDGTDGC